MSASNVKEDKEVLKKELTFYLHPLDDISGILELINLIYPDDGWTEEYFRWQYLDNPAGKAKIWVADHQGKVVSTYVAIPHAFKAKDYEGIAWMVQDVMTHPDFRGLGIMHELAVLCREAICRSEFPVNYTFPNEHSNNSFLRRGWSKAYRVPLRETIKFDEKNLEADILVKPIDQFDQSTDDLWNRAKKDIMFATIRDASYLNWRYLSRPQAKYHFFVATKAEQVVGALIMKYFNIDEQTTVTHVCDLFADSAVNGVVDILLNKAVSFSKEHHSSKLTAWLPPGHAHEANYSSFGFELDEELTRWVIVKSHEGMQEGVGADESKNWHLTQGDSDVY